MIKVLVQQNGKNQKEMSFKDRTQALRFMYMCPRKAMFIISYYGESEYDNDDICWLGNRVDLTKLNNRAYKIQRKEANR